LKQGEEAYLDYCLGIGLPKRSSFLLANFASKFHQALPKNNAMTNLEIVSGLQQTMSYYRSLTNNLTTLTVSELESLID